MTGRIVIVGGGFAGVHAAMYFDKALAHRSDIHVVLISRENFILFTPMLHEVAAGDLYPGDTTKNGVWSISAYRENFYERNPINRYGLLPAMVKYNPDSSLDVYLQAKSPGPDKESNWLPIPQSGWLT